MFKPLFHWLDQNPGVYWILVAAATVPLVVRLALMIRRDTREPAAPQAATWRDALGLFLFILAWRWPFLFVAYDFNPDESQMIAGAMTLTRDPVFWRAVDGGSSGPLNYYLLVPWHWIGAPLDYFTARLTCLLLTWGALFAGLHALARPFGRTVAWLGILPAAAFSATLTHAELTNLSTEHLPVLLSAVAFALLAARAPADRWRLWTACAVAGALPFTKLQAAPVGLVLIGWGCWQVLREPGLAAGLRWRRSGEVLLAAALPSLFFAGLAVGSGEVEAAWRRFILSNAAYVATDTTPTGMDAMRSLWNRTWNDCDLPLFLAIVGTGLLTAGVVLVRRRELPSSLHVAGATVALTTLVVVIVPRRDYLHYVLFLPVPFTLWFGAALGDWWRRLQAPRARLALAGAALAAGLLPLVLRSLDTRAPIFGGFSHHWKYPRSSVGAVVRAMARPNDTLALWGWAPGLHVETGLPQATRDDITGGEIYDHPQQAYYRAVYLADLQRQRPAVFVDAVGPGGCVFTDRAREAHEIFPELAAYIRGNYTLVMEQPDARVYARNDLPTLQGLDRDRLHQLVSQGRDAEKFLMSLPPGALDPLERKFIGKRKVAMLPPATRLEWPLEADMRGFVVEFGSDPGVGEGLGLDAGLTFEVIDPAATRPLFRRVLDPQRQSADRGLQTELITLPAFTPGSVLVLRTDPGRNVLYLASLRLHRAPDPVLK